MLKNIIQVSQVLDTQILCLTKQQNHKTYNSSQTSEVVIVAMMMLKLKFAIDTLLKTEKSIFFRYF